MRSFARLARFAAPLAVVAVVAAACGGGSGNALAPQWQPQITNQPDTNFHLQATGLADVSDVVSFTWHNSSGNALLKPANNTTGGSATLRITDGGGNIIHNAAIPASGDVPLSGHVAGNWTLRVTLSTFSGQIAFDVQQQ